jgi:hypothetical protein
MKISFQPLKFFSILITLAVIWAVFLISTEFLSEKENLNRKYVPSNTEWCMRINGNQLIRDIVYSIIFESDDSESIRELQKIWKEQQKLKTKFNDVGIDFNSDIFIFSQRVDKGMMVYFLFNMDKPHFFNKNIEDELGYFQAIAHNKKVGVIASYIGDADYMNVQEKANNIIQKTDVKPSKKPIQYSKNILTLSSKKANLGEYLLYSKKDLIANFNNKEFNCEGTYFFAKQDHIRHASWSLKPSKFYFSNSLFTEKIQDSIASTFQKIGMKTPRINHISLNYEGLSLSESQEGMIFFPDMELLLEFDEDVTLKSLFQDLTLLNELGFHLEGNKLIAGKNSLNIEFLDAKTLYIGKDKNNVTKSENPALFCLQGDLVNLSKINGGGFITAIISMYPPFKASRALSQSIQDTHFELKRTDKTTYTFKGNIEFKEKRQAVLEILKFVSVFSE